MATTPGNGLPPPLARPNSSGNLHRVTSNPGMQQQQQQQQQQQFLQPLHTLAPQTLVVGGAPPGSGMVPVAVYTTTAPTSTTAGQVSQPASSSQQQQPQQVLVLGGPIPTQGQAQAQAQQPILFHIGQQPQAAAAAQQQGGQQGGGGGGGGGGGQSQQGGGGGGQTLPQAFEKKLRRLEKNRESARECRRRKKEHVMELQQQVANLEAENLKLKLQLKVGEESQAQERQEKERITRKLDDMVKSGASEADIWQTIDMFKERYSDYGSDRRSAIEFHTNQLEKLLLPTKLTKLCMWMLLNIDDDAAAFLPRSGPSSATLASLSTLSLGGEEGGGGGAKADGNNGTATELELQQQQQHLQQQHQERKKAASPQAAKQLWSVLSGELGVTEAQQKALLQQRETVQAMDRDLQVTSGMLSELRALIDDKNSSLDNELLEVQKILTPTQTAKFILWITQNPACMHMLNQLWRAVYEKSDGKTGKQGVGGAAAAGGGGEGGGESGSNNSSENAMQQQQEQTSA